LSQSGSFLDGGANHPYVLDLREGPLTHRLVRLQLAAIPLLDPIHAAQERRALQIHFKAKRDHVLNRLHKLHLDVAVPPTSTFYIWLNLEKLPPPLNNGLVNVHPSFIPGLTPFLQTFFEELLTEKAIVIPGIFFDINPAHRRNLFKSPCHHFVRLSFGPSIETLDKGLDAIERVLKRVKTATGMKDIGQG